MGKVCFLVWFARNNVKGASVFLKQGYFNFKNEGVFLVMS